MGHRFGARRIPLALLAGAMVLSATAVGPATAAGQTARPGAQSGGERLYPGLGNGGYDVRSYDVAYDYRPGETVMNSSVDIVATARQALSSFSLDSVGQRIGSATVNGAPAGFRLDGDREKLVITPKRALARGLPFRVRIGFVADRAVNPPSPWFPEQDHFKNWVEKDDGFALFGQPHRSHLFFPMNDIPRDKARATFRITVPEDLQAVAGGTLTSRRTAGDRTTYVYTTRDPVPTDVMQAAVGHFTRTNGTGPGGVPLRSFVNTPDSPKAAPVLALIPDQMRWLEEQIGSPYPFETYGLLGVPGGYNNVALESATLSTFAADGLTSGPRAIETTMLHELVHQYFGDAVSVHSWDDMWLSEGHASYYAFRYMADKGDSDATFDENIHRAYDFDVDNRPVYGPPGRPADTLDVLGGTNAGGCVMLDGLHRMVGDATFRAIEHTFFEKYRGRSAATQDYIDVANAVSGKDLTSYIRSWVYGKTTPVPVGHPDWVTPPPSQSRS
ncbi:M1 family metallopeptidase [Streptomyces sp. TS71-3]|uniref:M1 family metallopeptidase n=1 Tax=Streptomyces sp. TS71-3 TaxID=2733862 RepID=UPI001B2D487F|nr:M1 family metallopeptidase [Streptomyces sp. TS71-3]GHJ39740.1 zinc metalloprotease [Streptomyces sp. TS71-3]